MPSRIVHTIIQTFDDKNPRQNDVRCRAKFSKFNSLLDEARLRPALLIAIPKIHLTDLPSTSFYIAVQQHHYRLIAFICPTWECSNYQWKPHYHTRTITIRNKKSARGMEPEALKLPTEGHTCDTHRLP